MRPSSALASFGAVDSPGGVARLGAAARLGRFAAWLDRDADGDRVARLRLRRLVLSGDVQVQLVALLTALDLVVNRLHALQVVLRDLVAEDRDLRVELPAEQ